jgi:hypothetical protein
MSLSHADSPSGCADASGPLEEIVERFEKAWREGRRPEIQDFLPPADPLRAAVLVELVHTDLEHRLKAGEGVRAEGSPWSWTSTSPSGWRWVAG